MTRSPRSMKVSMPVRACSDAGAESIAGNSASGCVRAVRLAVGMRARMSVAERLPKRWIVWNAPVIS